MSADPSLQAPKLTRMQVDGVRVNTERYEAQVQDTTALMPMLPKRILMMCNTIDALYDEVERLKRLETQPS